MFEHHEEVTVLVHGVLIMNLNPRLDQDFQKVTSGKTLPWW